MCGNAGGIKFQTTVLSFILRGINIFGIDSVNYSIENREGIWNKFANEWNVLDKLNYQEVELENIAKVFQSLQEGSHTGRTIVKLCGK